MTTERHRAPGTLSSRTARVARPRRDHDFDLDVIGNRIILHGDVDAASAPRLAVALALVAERRSGPVFVDASEVGVFGAAVVRALDTLSPTSGTTGRVVICDPTPTVRRVLEIVERTDLLGDCNDNWARSLPSSTAAPQLRALHATSTFDSRRSRRALRLDTGTSGRFGGAGYWSRHRPDPSRDEQTSEITP